LGSDFRFSSLPAKIVDIPEGETDLLDMNIAQIEEAVERGRAFKLKVADGDEFSVPHRDYISLPPPTSLKRTYVIVHNDKGFAHILPLLTITSLTYQADAPA
jgi:hypothetical protein